MLWTVSIQGRQTIIEARSEKAAIEGAIRAFIGPVEVHKTTNDEIEWQLCMGGYVPGREQKR